MNVIPLSDFPASPEIFESGINSLLASGDFCRLLITFANSLEPDRD